MSSATARVYLDHAATSPLRPQARAALTEYAGLVGNASSLHTSGRRARQVLEEARESLAADLGAAPAEVIFTSGGTEADNLAVQGSWLARRPGRNRVLASAIEHPAVAETVGALRTAGADAREIPVDAAGLLDLTALNDLLTEPTAVVSVMAVNNETGTAQDLAEVTRRAQAAGAWMHADAVQALGHLPIDFAASGLDLLSVSAHKVGGPIGIGALLARKDRSPRPIGHGGGQERDLRSGTLAPALAAAFAAAVRAATTAREADRAAQTRWRSRIAAAVTEIPGGRVNGAPGSPAIVNVSFADCRADDVLLLLDRAGIDVSTGSACTAGVHQPSPVLAAMGRTDEQARQSLRISMGWTTTDADITALLAALPESVARAQLAYS
ncbi:cysteine desulfurase family protein [Granulicoccus phenolivorans]|uniref:cysteine desulfurase family protein n=1 Tax=Granulicoccus phenolivorans TaxID=266854 RepID=UPI00040A9072|nr:cysteine desulfurase family protein [Granulicoccus phenolivorans]